MKLKKLNSLTLSRIYFFFFLLAISACDQSDDYKSHQDETSESPKVKESIISPPTKVAASNPIIYHLDSMPAPNVFVLGKKSSINGNDVFPKKDTASFFVSIQNFTTEQGLALDAISASYVDHHGNIWFSTYGGGVSKFDGTEFINYTSEHGLANDMVWSIAEDSNGVMWFGTDGGGLSRFDGRKFSQYSESDGMSSNIVYSVIVDKKGNVWSGSQGGGLIKFDGKSFLNYNINNSSLTANTIYSILEDENSNLWLGTDGAGVSRLKDGEFKNYTVNDGLAGNSIKCILEDSKGNIWMGSLDKGLSKYDGTQFINYTTEDGLSSNLILSLEEDNEGNIWIGTDGGGVDRFDGKSFVNFNVNQGMPNNIVRSIVMDKSGNLWFGTDGGGIGKYIGKSFTNYFTSQGLPNNVVWSITEDSDSNLWFGTDGGGASKYDGRFFTHYTTAQGLADNVVWCITEDSDSNLWFGTYGGGVSKFDGKSFTNYTIQQGLASDIIYTIVEDSTGNLWFGTHGNGVSKFDGSKFENYSTENGLSHDIIRVIEEDRNGNLWFATQGGGVIKYDGKYFSTYTSEDGLANDIVLDIYEDAAGILWFGTYSGGVSRFDGMNFLNYNSEQGLPDNTVTQVIGTDQGQLALGTNMGIAILESFSKNGRKNEVLSSINELENKVINKYQAHFEVYNSSTGYLVKDVNTGQSCMFLDSKGAIWLGTGSDKTALVRFDPSGLNHSKDAPYVFIKSVKLNEENILWNILASPSYKADSSAIATEEASIFEGKLSISEKDSMKTKYKDVQFESVAPFYPIPEKLVLPYVHNNIEFEFGAIETSKPDQLSYQFILEGYDKQWSPILKKSSASFGNISEGKYTFKLKAQNSVGIWSEPISFSFEVLPPWYRSWWAIGLYSILIFLFLYAIYRYRTASLRRDKEMLEQTVKERTAELFLQKEEAEIQRGLVEVKNREITDSINYALRIQQAILPKLEDIQMCFPNSFILYRPKDIVSGDFYFFNKLERDNSLHCDELFFIAAADCTGHGVPGALMSMVGFERLTDAVERSSEPNTILSMLNRGMKHSLHQDTDESTRDGLDIALCSIDLKNKILRFSGANRPLWYIRNGGDVVEEIKGTRAAIGGFTAEEHEFEMHEVTFDEGDTFYLFSDGYPDLFSSNGKKLTIKKFREKILQINKLQSMQGQKRELEGFADSWMSGEEQIDDILIIGLRF